MSTGNADQAAVEPPTPAPLPSKQDDETSDVIMQGADAMEATTSAVDVPSTTPVVDPHWWWREHQHGQVQTQSSSESTSVSPVTNDQKNVEDPTTNLVTFSSDQIAQWGDWVLLVFADGRHLFAEVKKGAGVKINRRTYPTSILAGLLYGTVLQVERNHLQVLPASEPLVPTTVAASSSTAPGEDLENNEGDGFPTNTSTNNGNDANEDIRTTASGTNSVEKTSEKKGLATNADNTIFDQPSSSLPATGSRSAVLHGEGQTEPVPDDKEQSVNKTESASEKRDNRHLVDSNTSQALDQQTLVEWRKTGTSGSEIVNELIQNSSTFATKTEYSQAKYILKKQMKYQVRCRLVQCTARTICQATFARDPKRYANLRPDTLASMLSHANITAGHSVLVWEDVHGIITGSVAERLGGYGKVFSIYTGQQPSSNEIMVLKFNFPFGILSSIQWVHGSDVFGSNESYNDDDDNNTDGVANKANLAESPPAPEDDVDAEAQDRDAVKWPCPLQDHTREYLKTTMTIKQQEQFLEKRAGRFARKLTRPSPLECAQQLRQQPVDSLILAVRNVDLLDTIQQLWPLLAPSAPFVIFCEYLEPLTECFVYLQEEEKCAIQLRLTTAWTREYQVLPQRTHPSMNMTQNGGFLLTGTKLHDVHGRHELDPTLLSKIRATLPTRRGKKRQAPDSTTNDRNNNSSSTTTTTTTTMGNENTYSTTTRATSMATRPSRVERILSRHVANRGDNFNVTKGSKTEKRKTPRKRLTPHKLPSARPIGHGEEEDDEERDKEDEKASTIACLDDENRLVDQNDTHHSKSPSSKAAVRRRKPRRREICVAYDKGTEALFFSKKRKKQSQPKQRPMFESHADHSSVVSIPSDDD